MRDTETTCAICGHPVDRTATTADPDETAVPWTVATPNALALTRVAHRGCATRHRLERTGPVRRSGSLA